MFDTHKPLLWDKQHGETNRAHTKWLVFRDLGPGRSLPKLHRTLAEGGQGVSLTALKKLSARWRWRARADAYDGFVAESAAGLLAQERAETVKQHLEGARLLRERAYRAVLEGKAGLLGGHVHAFAAAVRIERLSLGLPTQIGTKEAELRKAMEHALAAQDGLMDIVQRQLCPVCYERVAEAIWGVRAEQGQAREAADL